jgi:hypothetical protein
MSARICRIVIRVVSLAAFVVLAVSGHLRLWLVLLGVAGAAAFFGRRPYCYLFCPVRTVGALWGRIGRGRSRGKTRMPSRALGAAFRIAFILAFVCLWAFRIRGWLFVSLNLAGALAALVPGILWCRDFCPLGLIFDGASRVFFRRSRSLKQEPSREDRDAGPSAREFPGRSGGQQGKDNETPRAQEGPLP